MTPGNDGQRGTEPAPRRANIFDVARLAGVSHQTVSRVLNDLPNVRPATRARVEQAIKQLRYVPSPAARALVTRRTRTLGLIVTGAPDYGPSSTAMSMTMSTMASTRCRSSDSTTPRMLAGSSSRKLTVSTL